MTAKSDEIVFKKVLIEMGFFALALGVLGMSGCGHDFQNSFEGSPSTPAVSTGYNPACANSAPVPSPTPAPLPVASPTPAPSHHVSFPCNVAPWIPGCHHHSDIADTLIPLCDDPKAVFNTDFCQVDGNGGLSPDLLQVSDGERIRVEGGGCINRPIREVWGAVLNHGSMKPDDVNDYSASYRPDLVDASQSVVFAFNIANTVHALGGLVNPSWTVIWYHSVKLGTYAKPKQIVINYEKVDGTNHIKYQKGGWVLERVSPTVTSFVIDQSVSADRYDVKKGNSDFNSIINKLRTVTPSYDLLDQPSPVQLPSHGSDN